MLFLALIFWYLLHVFERNGFCCHFSYQRYECFSNNVWLINYMKYNNAFSFTREMFILKACMFFIKNNFV